MMIPLLVFLAVVTSIVGAYWVAIVVPESRGQSAVRRRLRWEAPAQASVQLLKKPDVLSTIGALNVVLGALDGLTGPLKKTIDQANLRLTVGAFLLMSACCFFAAGLAVDVATHLWWLGAAAGAGAMFIPLFVVRFLRTRRVRQFEDQFPEAIALISRSMRAGHAFATGLKMVADEMKDPVGPEFRLLYEKQNYGSPLPDALRSFAERVPSLDGRFFVTAVLTQREAGGNLAEVLDRLADVMRERFRIKREVRVRSAHGRITAYVLAGMPPVLATIMLGLNPGQIRTLTNDPLGVKMIIGAALLQITGTLIVRKLVDIEY